MSHFRYYLFLTLALVLGSCTKEDQLIGKISDSLRGEYKCVSMTWLGSAIDLNSDGILNSDMIKEFSSFENAAPALLSSAFIFPTDCYHQENRITLIIPMQFIKYNKLSKQYSLMNGQLGGRYSVAFSFAVREDGSLSFTTINEELDNAFNVFWENDSEIEGLDYRSTCGHHVISLKNGAFSVQIIGTYYDFASQQLVTGPVNLTYERVSYSVPLF